MILSLETSTNVCSIAIHEASSGRLINYFEIQQEKAHSAWLTVLVEQAITFSGKKIQNIEAVAVSAGPGSYTGLRIGVSVAKGICYALEKPLIAVSPLEAMMREVISYSPDHQALYCPMIDARRMEVYTAIYTHTGELIKNTHALIVTPDCFQEYLAEGKKIALLGNGADKCASIFTTDDYLILPHVYPSAKWVGKIAIEKFQKANFEDVAYFEPDYLKEFMATTAKKKF